MSAQSEDDVEKNDDKIGKASANEGEGSKGRGGITYKKGKWSKREDQILVEYVQKNGHKNWKDVAENSGLSRGGVSCRSRWMNFLRPDLKKSEFSEEEVRCVVELHAKHGNKWSKIAAEFPGRSVYDIRKFLYARKSKQLLADEQACPSEIVPERSTESGVRDVLDRDTSGSNSLDLQMEGNSEIPPQIEGPSASLPTRNGPSQAPPPNYLVRLNPMESFVVPSMYALRNPGNRAYFRPSESSLEAARMGLHSLQWPDAFVSSRSRHLSPFASPAPPWSLNQTRPSHQRQPVHAVPSGSSGHPWNLNQTRPSSPRQPVHAVPSGMSGHPWNLNQTHSFRPRQPVHAVPSVMSGHPWNLNQTRSSRPRQPVHAVPSGMSCHPWNLNQTRSSRPRQPVHAVPSDRPGHPWNLNQTRSSRPRQPVHAPPWRLNQIRPSHPRQPVHAVPAGRPELVRNIHRPDEASSQQMANVSTGTVPTSDDNWISFERRACPAIGELPFDIFAGPKAKEFMKKQWEIVSKYLNESEESDDNDNSKLNG